MKKSILSIARFISRMIPDKLYLKIIFRHRLKRKLNLKNPKYFNDKIQWLKLFKVKEEYSIYTDKYLVRTYVENTIGSEYLNEIYGVYDNAFSINDKDIPYNYIIKLTHGSGFNIVKKDGSLNNQERKKVNRWKNKKFHYKNREMVYKNIKPKILVERLIEDSKYNQIIDYKIHCFHGKPHIIQTNYEFDGKPSRNIYDLKWNKIDVVWSYENKQLKIEKPKKLHKMLELATKLSSPFIYSRIDFYYINDKIIFGEITFFPSSGTVLIKPVDYEEYLGSLIKLDLLKGKEN